MPYIFEEHDKRAIRIICTDQTTIAGCGMAVSNKCIVTCTHVVQKALGIKQELTEEIRDINISFISAKGRSRGKARCIESTAINLENGDDLTLLEITDSSDLSSCSLAELCNPDSYYDLNVRILKFDPLGTPPHIVSCATTEYYRGSLVRVLSDKEDNLLEEGISGSPVYCDKVNGYIGIACSVYQGRNEGYFIPCSAFTEKLKTFDGQLIKNVPVEYSNIQKYFSEFNKIIYPENQDFDLTVSNSNGKPDYQKRPLPDIIQWLKRYDDKMFLLGGAGIGKTFSLRRLLFEATEHCSKDAVAPIYINLKKWTESFCTAESFTKKHDNHDDYNRDESIEVIQFLIDKCSAVDRDHSSINIPLSLRDIIDSPNEILLVLDALNEVKDKEVRKRLIAVVSKFSLELAKNSKKVYVLVSDREGVNNFCKWSSCCIDYIDTNRANSLITQENAAAGELFDSLSDKCKELYSLPFFLAKILKEPDLVSTGSRTEFIENFIKNETLESYPDEEKCKDLTRFNSMLDKLAEIAYAAYRDEGTTFNYEIQSEKDSDFKQFVEHLIDRSILVSGKDPEQISFSHQLFHDYFAARFLSRFNPDENKTPENDLWDSPHLDVLTLEASSNDAFIMAVEQLKWSNRDIFIERAYNWNWQLCTDSISILLRQGETSCGARMLQAILALVGEKRFDPIESTKNRAQDLLKMFPEKYRNWIDSCTLRAQLIAPNELFTSIPGEGTFDFDVFSNTFVPGKLSEEHAKKLFSKGSVLGWCAANSVKTVTDLHDDSFWAFLRGGYHSIWPLNDNDSQAVRWRIVHSLGAYGSRENRDLLCYALEKDTYHWAKYGSFRSLIEIARSLDSRKDRKEILSQITDILNDLPETETKRLFDKENAKKILTITDETNIPDGWNDDIKHLVEMFIN